MQTPTESPNQRSLLNQLRSLIPTGAISLGYALQVAEQQADYLLSSLDASTSLSITDTMGAFSRLTVVYDQTPVDGLSYWNGTSWIIVIQARAPLSRRRYSFAREVGYIIWHEHLECETPDRTNELRHIINHFAYSLLIPAPTLDRLWTNGIRDIDTLSHTFGVSHHVTVTRLIHLRPWLNINPPRHTTWHSYVERPPAHAETITGWIRGDCEPEVTP
ncbi:MAG: hypothetical protein QOH56_2713 [Pseudonocardiales bacterium]|jgi:hypothetical protein|nr:hypothetical protein [Pseudonocardiales bacterium]